MNPNEDQDPASSPRSDASTVSNLGSPTMHSSTLYPPATQETEQLQAQGAVQLAKLQEELQTVLEYVDHGMILKSFDTLSRLTEITVTNCESLGLTLDSGAMEQKEGFWTGLNNCWLFAFSHYGNARSEDQRLREEHLHHLHKSVQTWADSLERYGLINYEFGFWEQDILEAIEVCLINSSIFSGRDMDDDGEDDDDDDGDDDGLGGDIDEEGAE